MPGLKRKQIYVDRENDRRIDRLARETELSGAEHIRRGVAAYVAPLPDERSPRHRLLDLIGLCDAPSGRKDAAVHHDRYLHGRKR